MNEDLIKSILLKNFAKVIEIIYENFENFEENMKRFNIKFI